MLPCAHFDCVSVWEWWGVRVATVLGWLFCLHLTTSSCSMAQIITPPSSGLSYCRRALLCLVFLYISSQKVCTQCGLAIKDTLPPPPPHWCLIPWALMLFDAWARPPSGQSLLCSNIYIHPIKQQRVAHIRIFQSGHELSSITTSTVLRSRTGSSLQNGPALEGKPTSKQLEFLLCPEMQPKVKV